MDDRRLAIALLAAYVLFGLVDVVAEAAGQALLLRLVPLVLMPLLAGYVWCSRPLDQQTSWVLVALGFAWFGDVLGGVLLVKIALFLGAQVAYCVAFRRSWRASPLLRRGPGAAYAVGMGALIVAVAVAARAGGLTAAVAVYGGILALMLALAVGVSRLAGLGAALFVVSDLVLAYGAFVDPPADRWVGATVMATYLAAQLMIVVGARTPTTAGAPSVAEVVSGRR